MRLIKLIWNVSGWHDTRSCLWYHNITPIIVTHQDGRRSLPRKHECNRISSTQWVCSVAPCNISFMTTIIKSVQKTCYSLLPDKSKYLQSNDQWTPKPLSSVHSWHRYWQHKHTLHCIENKHCITANILIFFCVYLSTKCWSCIRQFKLFKPLAPSESQWILIRLCEHRCLNPPVAFTPCSLNLMKQL